MDARSWTFIASVCLGKESFSTPQLANKVQRRRAKHRGTYKVKQRVYRCKTCGNFHIGTETKSRQDTTSSRRKIKAYDMEHDEA